MEYSWNMEETGSQDTRNTRIQRHQGPGLIDELEAFMGPVGECIYPPAEARPVGAHQLPESPPDSGSEHPYSPDRAPPLPPDYMLVHDMQPDMLHAQEYITYEELKSDGLGLSSVPLPQEQMLGLYRYGIQDLDQGIMSPQLVVSHELPPVYTTLAEPGGKKRKHSQEGSQVKCEPAILSPEISPPQPPPAPASVDGSEAGDDAFQCIRFSSFQQNTWRQLYDHNLKLITPPSYVVGADKGFNYSLIDEAFVCQKKNHFQVTCQIHMVGDPQYIKTGDGFKKINQFFLHFYGVKAEDPSQEVRIEQSQSDRTKKPFHPVPVELRREGTKVTVGRLHFAETTNNNMRKKGRPNPDQRHFQLVVSLRAHCQAEDHMLAAQASDRIIVRASNPGQFESDCSEGWWQRGAAENSVHFSGRVGINTDRPDEACVVNGNLKVMGHIVHPSDARAKHNIEELDPEQQLKNIQSIRVVKFNYDPSFAEHSGLVGFDPSAPSPACDTGVIAQEVREVLPEAVKEAGDVALNNGRTIQQFLVVNKDRIFMENLGAVKQLCKVTGHLESRIDQLEKINRRLCGRPLQRRDSARSSISNDSRFSGLSNSSKSISDNFSTDHIRDIARNIRRHECCHKLSHNSPKYTRKQCKSCHSNNNSKYAKYYNTNKTNCVRYHKDNDLGRPSLNAEVLPDGKKDKDTCLWVREDGNTTFCCAKKNAYGETEIISNKFLQIFIAILIFIMAVCLVVMSALYFHEHQALISMKELKLRDRMGWNFNSNGKFGGLTTHRPAGDNGIYSNQIQNLKQHATAKKTLKEKGPHKTTSEFPTTPPQPEALPPAPTAPPPAAPPGPPPPPRPHNYLNNALNIEQPSPRAARPAGAGGAGAGAGGAGGAGAGGPRSAEVLGSGCALDNALNAELDVDCQSSCHLDTQSYDNQEPIENLPDKLTNDTHYPRPLEKPIPIIPAKNDTKTENESLKYQLRDEISDAESNFLDPNKVINTTDNETFRRYKRTVVDTSGSKVDTNGSKSDMSGSKVDTLGSKTGILRRMRRETSEVQRAGSYEFFEHDHSSSEDEVEPQDCDVMTFGVNSKTFNNESMFEETVCANTVYNFTYMVPVSKCLKERHIVIVIGFNSAKSKHKSLHLCLLNCKYDTTKSCDLNREIAKPTRNEETLGASWRSTVTLDCNTDTSMTLRASHAYSKDLCELTSDDKVPFIEYNVRIFRDCHN